MRRRGWIALAGLGALLTAAAAAAAADQSGIRRITGTFTDALYLAGRELVVRATVSDDVIAAAGRLRLEDTGAEDLILAGGDVEVERSTAEDVFVAGGSVALRGVTADDLYAAGGSVDLAAEIGDDAFVAAGRVRLRHDNAIAGNLRLAAGDAVVDGRIGGTLTLAAGSVRIEGTVGGDVLARSDDVALGPAARIGGVLRYSGGEPPHIAEGAVVAGGLERMAPKEAVAGRRWLIFGAIGTAVAGLIGLAVLALAAQWAMPRLLAETASRLEDRLLESLGIGAAIGLLGPPVLLLLAVTLVGLPLALLAGLMLALLVVLASIALAWCLGGWARVRLRTYAPPPGLWSRTLWTFAGMIAILVVSAIPFVGWAVIALALLTAIGGLVVPAARRLA